MSYTPQQYESEPSAYQPPVVSATPRQKFPKLGIIGLIGGILMIVGICLPWYDFTNYAGPMFLGIQCSIFGILPFIFAILGLILMFLKKPVGGMLTFIFGLIGFIFVILINIILSAWATTYGGGAITTLWSVVSYGWYLTFVGSILLFVGGILVYRVRKKALAPPLVPVTPPYPPRPMAPPIAPSTEPPIY